MLDKGHFERFDRLLKADPQLLNSFRGTEFLSKDASLLMKAVEEEKPDMVSKLLKYPQDLNIVNKDGENVLHVATYQNNKWLLDELKKNIDVEEFKKLLNSKNTINGGTPLHCAAFHNHHKSIQWLLMNGADVNAMDSDGDLADKQMFGNAGSKRLIREHRNQK